MNFKNSNWIIHVQTCKYRFCLLQKRAKERKRSEPFVLLAIPLPVHFKDPALKPLNKEFVRLKLLEALPIGYPIEFCSPLLVVKKPNKDEPCLVCHYKKLNSMLSGMRHVPAVRLRDFMRVTQGFRCWFDPVWTRKIFSE